MPGRKTSVKAEEKPDSPAPPSGGETELPTVTTPQTRTRTPHGDGDYRHPGHCRNAPSNARKEGHGPHPRKGADGSRFLTAAQSPADSLTERGGVTAAPGQCAQLNAHKVLRGNEGITEAGGTGGKPASRRLHPGWTSGPPAGPREAWSMGTSDGDCTS